MDSPYAFGQGVGCKLRVTVHGPRHRGLAARCERGVAQRREGAARSGWESPLMAPGDDEAVRFGCCDQEFRAYGSGLVAVVADLVVMVGGPADQGCDDLVKAAPKWRRAGA
ncbi:hypothetical protein [Nocardia abscessus]|uniref:hypothetical protein n=1 Tax=Nocardia abscessus TaxID=120957 RepID=UPI0012FC29E9|nr:hypothetical protein [Nocardia abscessus]MCC3332971.1 hypothetical protein [Nocardia abscessus]